MGQQPARTGAAGGSVAAVHQLTGDTFQHKQPIGHD